MSELRSENNEINIFSSSEVTSLLSIVSQDIFPLSWILWNTQRVKFFYSLMSYFVKKKLICVFLLVISWVEGDATIFYQFLSWSILLSRSILQRLSNAHDEIHWNYAFSS